MGATAASLLAGVGEEESGLVVAAASPWASPFSATICRCWFLREEEKRLWDERERESKRCNEKIFIRKSKLTRLISKATKK